MSELRTLDQRRVYLRRCGVYLMIRPNLGCEFVLAFDEDPLLNPNIAYRISENLDDKDRIIREELLRLVEESKSK